MACFADVNVSQAKKITLTKLFAEFTTLEHRQKQLRNA